MPRFFIPPVPGESETVTLTGEDARHIAKSLRMQPKERLILCDGAGCDLETEITAVSADRVTAKILSRTRSLSEPDIFVTLYLPFLKGGHMEDVLKQAVEIGVSRVVPMLTSRCVARPSAGEAPKKADRLRKISEGAAGQSGRGRIPAVGDAVTFAEAIRLAKADDCAIFAYEGATRPLKDILSEGKRTPRTVSVITGPEGGFEPSEVQIAESEGVLPVSLGKRILRAETAPIYLLSALLYTFETPDDEPKRNRTEDNLEESR